MQMAARRRHRRLNGAEPERPLPKAPTTAAESSACNTLQPSSLGRCSRSSRAHSAASASLRPMCQRVARQAALRHRKPAVGSTTFFRGHRSKLAGHTPDSHCSPVATPRVSQRRQASRTTSCGSVAQARPKPHGLASVSSTRWQKEPLKCIWHKGRPTTALRTSSQTRGGHETRRCPFSRHSVSHR